MLQARSGAAAAGLYDGSLLVAGGTDATGNVSATVEIFGADGSFHAAPPMQVARTGHTATWLSSGYVLVAGGATTGGAIVNSAELYDPLAMQWTLLPSLSNARTGHTATVLPNGDVLLAGGQNAAGPVAGLEVFHAATQTFSPAGALGTARQAQAAAALSDGRVIIIGGTDVNGATLASTEIYSSKGGTVTAGPALTTPRTAATATTLLDGTVLIAAGAYPEGALANNGVAELQTAEIFDPVAGAITALSAQLNHARSGQLAFLLPSNSNVLLDGGVAQGADLAQAELYTPWTQTFSLTGVMAAARSQAVGGALAPLADGLLLVAGGSDLASAELYGFATIKTDKGDYAPGTPVNITGAGWQPGETVSLYLRESPVVETPAVISVNADGNGNLSNSTFAPAKSDLGVHFYLTAVGAQSQAQTMFADGLPPFISIDCEPDPVAIGSPTACAVSLAANASCTPADGTVITWSSTGSLSAAACTLSGLGCTVNFTPTGLAETVSATYPDTPGCLSQQATVQPGLQAALSLSCPEAVYNGNPHTCTGTATGVGGAAVSGSWSYNPASATNAGSYPVTATFSSGDPNYAGGTVSAILKIDASAIPPALAINCPEVTYDGNPHTCSGTATGLGGVAVNGAWSFSAVETNAGVYPEIGSFTSSDPNYSSGGTIGGTLTIDQARPVMVVTCGTYTYDANPHSCTAAATGVSGGAVAGAISLSPASGTAAGQYHVTAIFSSNDPNYVGNDYAYGYLYINPILSITGLLVFNPQIVGTQSLAQYVTVTNIGTLAVPVSGTGMVGPNPANFGDYLVTDYSGTCTTTMVLQPGKKCVLRVVFAPQSVGASDVWMGVNSPGFAFQAATLEGTGVAGVPQLTYTPPSLTYNTQSTGVPSAAQYVLITSTGTGPLHVTNVTLGGANAGDFTVADQSGTCVEGEAVAVGSKCNLQVVFTPTAAGARTATLYLNDDAAGSPQQVTLTGTGQLVAGMATLSATTLTFPPVNVGTAATTQYVDIHSTGFVPLVIQGVSIVSGNAADFTLSNQYGTCLTGMTLQVGQECDIRVVFDPTAAGTRGALLLISTAPPAVPYTVQLNGTGVALVPQLTLSLPSLTFAAQTVNTSSGAQYVQLTSSGTGPVIISGVATSGLAAKDYKVTDQAGTCVEGVTLAPGAKCNLRVIFDPTTTGDRSASVVITDNAGGHSFSVDGAGK